MESLLLLRLPSPASRPPLPPASARSSRGGSHSDAARTTHPPRFRSVRPLGRSRPRSRRFPLLVATCRENAGGAEDAKGIIQELRIPDSWLLPSKALEESEWLRAALHKWLDDEYCPEPMNAEISRVAAQSYHNSMVAAKEAGMAEILLRMIGDLESLSYQESFHGAFSAANAAVTLITARAESQSSRSHSPSQCCR